MYDFESQIVDIPDYPEPGVIFKDITPLFGNPEALKAMTDALAEHFAGMGITKVVCPEARGFMVGVPVAVALGAGFVPARKPVSYTHLIGGAEIVLCGIVLEGSAASYAMIGLMILFCAFEIVSQVRDSRSL